MQTSSNIDNGRGGKPSASKMTRIFNCPASFRLNALETPESSPAADEGTMLHRVCELFLSLKTSAEAEELERLWNRLDAEQQAAAEFARDEARRIIDSMKEEADTIWDTEHRLWSRSGLFSGKGDLIVLSATDVAIVDYKFGRGEVERAENNYQLAAMAVLVADNYDDVDCVRAVIIQPRALEKSKRITECLYDQDDIAEARKAINAACENALNAEKPAARCGYWCNYCPSAYRCAEAQREIDNQRELAAAMPRTAITTDNARALFDKANLVKKLCDEILAAVKKFVADNPDADCGLCLKEGARRAKLGDAGKVFEAVESAGISAEEFVGVCDVSLTRLLNLWHAKRAEKNDKQKKVASDKEARALLGDAGLLNYSQNAPTLAAVESEAAKGGVR